MKCPGCGSDLQRLQVGAVLASSVEIDACAPCHGFWFDAFETLKLSARSTLELFQFIANAGQARPLPASKNMKCPRCSGQLKLSRDRQRNTPFQYWSCAAGHGRFMPFNDFLKEKQFVQALSPQQIAELKQKVRTVNCSNCGAPVDLLHQSACVHCRSPLLMLDRAAMSEVAVRYRKTAEESRPITLPPVNVAESQSMTLLDFDLESIGEWLFDLLSSRSR